MKKFLYGMLFGWIVSAPIFIRFLTAIKARENVVDYIAKKITGWIYGEWTPGTRPKLGTFHKLGTFLSLEAEAAKERYKDILRFECPDCQAQVGELCRSEAVWVHYERHAIARGEE